MGEQNRGGAGLHTVRPAGSGRWRRGAALLLCLLLPLAPALAHESEQYTLPAGRDFADLGPQLSRSFMAAIRAAVDDTNAAIDAALQSGALPQQLQALQSADHVASQVWGRLFNTYPTNELLDLALIAPATQSLYPGLVTMYRPVESVYDDPLLQLDPSKLVRTYFRAGTVSAGGVLFGTDKIVHFINVGRIYHLAYLVAIERGLDEAAAMQWAVQSTGDNPLLSEDGWLGRYTTGIRSNGDLAADYAGLKFYRNLTEAVQMGPALRPPMLERDGPYWRLAGADADKVFSDFVSPHWNEVLNPNTYVDYVGHRMRSVVATRCEDVAEWYRGSDGQPLDAAWFQAQHRQLSTWFGEPYGHELEQDGAVSVAALCGPSPRRGAAAAASTPLWWGAALPAGQADALGRNAVWWAAAAGDAGLLQSLHARGLPLDQPDRDGETPLHAAVRHGHLQAVQWLLAQGADPNHASAQGVRPLLLAVAQGHADVAQRLLAGGAAANAADRFGRTALHEAALRGDVALAQLLLHHGADATLASRYGDDALTVAGRATEPGLQQALRASAAVVRKLGPAGPERDAGRAAALGHVAANEGPDVPTGLALPGPQP